MQSDSKIFVTGHRGLYGKALCKKLKEKGLINFDNNVSSYIPEFKNLKCKDENGKIFEG